jgi:hypothetical protein
MNPRQFLANTLLGQYPSSVRHPIPMMYSSRPDPKPPSDIVLLETLSVPFLLYVLPPKLRAPVSYVVGKLFFLRHPAFKLSGNSHRNNWAKKKQNYSEQISGSSEPSDSYEHY